MKMINSLVSGVQERDTLVDSIVQEATKLSESLGQMTRLGLLSEGSGGVQIQAGDFVVDPADQSVFVATGAFKNGKPIVKNKVKSKVVEPELLVVGTQAKTPFLQRIAQKIGIAHPNRRVLVYGDAPVEEPTPELDIHEGKIIVPGIVAESAKDSNPAPEGELPCHDLGIAKEMTKVRNKKSGKGESTEGSEVHNNKTPWKTWMLDAGKTEKHDPLGDQDEGNEFCPKEAKKKGAK